MNPPKMFCIYTPNISAKILGKVKARPAGEEGRYQQDEHLSETDYIVYV